MHRHRQLGKLSCSQIITHEGVLRHTHSIGSGASRYRLLAVRIFHVAIGKDAY